MADAVDACPDRIGLPPDGCPPVDRDGDRVVDGDDACPDVPGPAEAGGCPDHDGDGDGVADRLDECPGERGSAELHGCPPPDRDDDAVADAVDRCPDQAETWNGVRDGDGCPDGEPLVRVGGGRVELSVLPRPGPGGRLDARTAQAVALAARAVRSAGGRRVTLVVVAEYGLSYGDSLDRARRRARLLVDPVARALGVDRSLVEPVWRGPDGRARIELIYR